MIILEGPDGAGKTTLLDRLYDDIHSLPIHERASDGINGPVKNLYDWAHRDVTTWSRQPLAFYDRHPLVSEYIYGPIVRGTMDAQFHVTPHRRTLAQSALVIVCLPPLDVVRRSVSDERDMPGVTTHTNAIWHAYASLRATWSNSVGLLFYDWTETLPTRTTSFSALLSCIRHHQRTWEYKHD